MQQNGAGREEDLINIQNAAALMDIERWVRLLWAPKLLDKHQSGMNAWAFPWLQQYRTSIAVR